MGEYLKYKVQVNTRTILIETTSYEEAKACFEANKNGEYGQLLLSGLKNIPYEHNWKSTVWQVLEGWCKKNK